ncbi:MAG: carboxylating nicotinate-nucleotide diphosphorylase [Candidatus Bathyarchaeota archaeon]
MEPLEYRLIEKIKKYLDEDIGYGDITSETLIPDPQMAKAKLYFKEPGVVSGLAEATAVFKILGCSVQPHARDAERTEARKTLLSVEGSARALLMGERLALNFVGRMAGIATQTAKIVEDVAKRNPYTRVAATRKTLPGLREFDKRAVVHGGGDPHRFGLDDCVLIKDNHLELVPSVTEAVKRARAGISFTKMIEIEVRSLEDAVEAARAGADIIMFDNMSPAEIRENLGKLNALGLREGIIFEASGGITADNAGDYAAAGVDVVSLGALTHSVHSLDVKFEIEMIK